MFWGEKKSITSRREIQPSTKSASLSSGSRLSHNLFVFSVISDRSCSQQFLRYEVSRPSEGLNPVPCISSSNKVKNAGLSSGKGSVDTSVKPSQSVDTLQLYASSSPEARVKFNRNPNRGGMKCALPIMLLGAEFEGKASSL
jgi:hypothetical protein